MNELPFKRRVNNLHVWMANTSLNADLSCHGSGVSWEDMKWKQMDTEKAFSSYSFQFPIYVFFLALIHY